VSIRFGRLLAAYTIFVFLPAAGCAQGPGARLVKLDLRAGGELPGPGYSCMLQDLHSHQPAASGEVLLDGTVTLRDIPYGDYRLTVTDFGGAAVHEEIVTVSQFAGPIVVNLPRQQAQRPPSGPVSIAQLEHPPSPKAVAEAASAQRYFEAGDYGRAAAGLEKALRISPDFLEARNNLAVVYIRLGDYQRAVDEIGRASAIAKPGPVQLCNLAFAELQLKRYDQAVEAARSSLRLDSGYAQAHFVLGVLLARRPATLREALPHLERAAQTLPSAQAALDLARKSALSAPAP
jgi:hypothetical protein